MDLAVTIDDAVLGEVVHSCRTKEVGRRPGRRIIRTSRENVVFCLHEIGQATCLKLRGEDLPRATNAEEVEVRPPPMEVRGAVAEGIAPLRERHSILTVGSLLGLVDQLERSRRRTPSPFEPPHRHLGAVLVAVQRVPGNGGRMSDGLGQMLRDAR